MNLIRMTVVMLALVASHFVLPIAHAQPPPQPPAAALPQPMAGTYERITVHGASLVGQS